MPLAQGNVVGEAPLAPGAVECVLETPRKLAPTTDRVAKVGEKRGADPDEASTTFREPLALKDVAAFHGRFGRPVAKRPRLPDRASLDLRLALIEEEVAELRCAFAADDLVEAADALADIQYVLSGTVLELGMGSCFANLFSEVHRSNMSKACASRSEADRTVQHYRDTKGVEAKIEEVALDGCTKFLVKRASDEKCLKSIAFSPPDLAPILASAGADTSSLPMKAVSMNGAGGGA